MGAELTIDRIARHPILSCSPDLPIKDAASYMYTARSSSIVIMEDGVPIGIWTERDALDIDFSDAAALERPVGEVMSSPVKRLPSSLPLSDAGIHFKQDRLRHYLLEEDGTGRLLGIVSQSDLVMSQGVEYFLHMRDVGSLNRLPLVTVPETATANEAAQRMREMNVDAVAVQYADGTEGILSERDIVRHLGFRSIDAPVGELASFPLLCTTLDSSLYDARSMLIEKHVRHLGVRNESGQLVGMLAHSDILDTVEQEYAHNLWEALRQCTDAIRMSSGHLRLAVQLFETSFEGIMITDTEGVIGSVNPAFCRLTGYTQQEIVGRNAADLGSSEDQPPQFYARLRRRLKRKGRWRGETWLRRKNGETVPKMMTVTGIECGEPGAFTHFAAVFNDVVCQDEHAQRVHYLATHDPLTGLANRAQFRSQMAVTVDGALQRDDTLALMLVNLDQFRRINDTLGHAFGDAVLRRMAERIEAWAKPRAAVLGRIDGDEFGLLLRGIPQGRINALARELVRMLGERTVVDGQDVYLTVSVGIGLFPGDGRDAVLLEQAADIALSQARRAGGNRHVFHTSELNVRAQRSLFLEYGLREALERKEFVLHYQPQVDLRTGDLIGMEALIRWRSATGGLIPPDQFLPSAEETGLMPGICKWVLDEACHQAREWQRRGLRDLRVAVNLSLSQFSDPERMIEDICSALSRSRLQAHHLELEITESMAMEDPDETCRTLERLSSLGLKLAIDDFGTGYSSLAHLRRFPVSVLKIDKSFVNDLGDAKAINAIPTAIISLAQALDMDVVAEGIETATQRDILRTLGCQTGQGYYFNRPLAADEFSACYLHRTAERDVPGAMVVPAIA